jgi:succinoglycan biosynthesis protein ExoO
MRAHAAALGEWLAPLDGDDAWLPERLDHLLSSPGADEADAISDDVLRVEADGRAWRCLHHRWQTPLVLDQPRWLDACDIIRHHLGVLQPLMRRQFLETHRLGIPDAPVANDLYLYLEMMLTGARWLQVPGAYYLYYATAGLVTSSWSQHGDKLLSNHARYANCRAVQSRPALRSEFARFLRDERVSLLIEQLRTDVRQHALRPAAVRLLAQPELLHRVVGQAIRRSLVKVKRERARVELR